MVAKRSDQVHVVLDNADRHATVGDLANDAPDFANERRRYAGGRLVQQDDSRVKHECPRKLQELLLSAGKSRGQIVGFGSQVHLLEHAQRALAGLGFACPDAPAPEQRTRRIFERTAIGGEKQVFEDGQIREFARDLERADNTKLGNLVQREAGDVDAVEQDSPGVRRHQPGNDIQKRRLSGSVRPDQSRHETFLEVDGAVGQRRNPAEMLRDVQRCEHGAHASARLTSCCSEKAGSTERCVHKMPSNARAFIVQLNAIRATDRFASRIVLGLASRAVLEIEIVVENDT